MYSLYLKHHNKEQAQPFLLEEVVNCFLQIVTLLRIFIFIKTSKLEKIFLSCIFELKFFTMKIYTTFFLLVFCLLGCAQKKRPIQGETEFQKKMNSEYKDATTSPLKDKDRKHFEGLDFFNLDSSFVVKAAFKRTLDEKPFKMKTTTDRLPMYVKYGELSFQLKEKEFKLNIYQNQGLIEKEGYEDYLFLPFLDETNGLESYGGGRFMDAKIPEDDTIIIDFNKAYNPYCAYNDTYSCPIVPRENYLKIRIEAGVKAFEEH